MTGDHNSLATIGQPQAAKEIRVADGRATLAAVKQGELDPSLVIEWARVPSHTLGSLRSGVPDRLDWDQEAHETPDAR
jgi:hypothetical protein